MIETSKGSRLITSTWVPQFGHSKGVPTSTSVGTEISPSQSGQLTVFGIFLSSFVIIITDKKEIMINNLKVNQEQIGIWRHHSYFPKISDKFRLTLGEGRTKTVVVDGVVCKREDENPTGSIKDRGLAYQISATHEQGHRNLIISSSGNAAISAASYCQLAKIQLHVFVSPKINREKLDKIIALRAKVNVSLKPVSQAVKFSLKTGYLNLRPSRQENGVEGYKSLAFELHETLGRISSLFIPVSSGTALVGLAAGYKILGYCPQLQVVQSTSVCPIASLYDKDFKLSNESLADGLVARVVPRRGQIVSCINNSGGWGWVISDSQIEEALQKLGQGGIVTSAEGGAAYAAIGKAMGKNKNLGDKVVCLLTGKKYLL